MMIPNAYLPAFPYAPPPGAEGYPYPAQGMLLLDYFAARAMEAAATNPKGADGFTFAERAVWAYDQAEAMLAERNRRLAL